MKKWIAFFCAIVVILSTLTVAFATEDQGLTCLEPAAVTDTLTPSISEGSEPTLTLTPNSVQTMLNGATVNVSEQSVEQIATAVAMSSSDRFTADKLIVTSGGNSLYIPSALLEVYPYFVVGQRSPNPLMIHLFKDRPPGVDFSGYELTSDTYAVGNAPSSGGYWTFYDSPSSFTLSIISKYSNVYSNFDIYYNGDLVHAADEEPYIPVPVISFDTGFDDLIIEDQHADFFVLPTPSKPGYMFLGWYLDPEFTTLYTADYEFPTDTTLYAKWTEEPPMAFFSKSLFNAFTVMLESEPIFYLVSLMGLVLILGICKILVCTRL